MCVLIIKDKGIKMPSKNELKLAALHNPHGFGFVSSNGFYYRTMDFEDFYKHLKGVRKEDACIIHFRIATHGSHKVDNCHPFNLGDIYFAHNGILPIRTAMDMTDSETEFRNVLYPAAMEFGLGSATFNGIVNRRIYNSKFAFMQNGEIFLYGRYIYDKNGIAWSNMNHRPYCFA